MMRATCVVIAMLSSTKVAAAEEMISLTWSPIHLVLPVFEIEAEYNLAPNMGAGLILGAGRVSDSTNTVTATAYEVGAQGHYYFMERFEGLHAGVEVLYLTLGDVEQDSTVTASGLSAGPYVGYKLMTSVGFTFVAQGGASILLVQAESSTQMMSKSKVAPLLNLNVGWSF